MNLIDIYEEISVGIHNLDRDSKRLQKHVDEIRTVLQSEGAILEKVSYDFSREMRSLEGGVVFVQGSYATNTAIKHDSYDVDADLGFMFDIILNEVARLKMYNLLKKSFPNYSVELRKPCITVDFKDSYKVDLAVYYKNGNDNIYYLNSICGHEQAIISKPKELISEINKYLKDNEMRKVIRLSKHFLKKTLDDLALDDRNKIPSISVVLFCMQNYRDRIDFVNESSLYEILMKVFKDLKNYIHINRTNGPSDSNLAISNTFYKICDITQTMRLIDTVITNLEARNYSALVEKRVFENLQQKGKVDQSSSLMGTFGSEN